MSKNQAQENTEVAKEIFRQLQASKVNGLPFMAYTGAKAKIYSPTTLQLKVPKNPKNIDEVLVHYVHGSDTYTIYFNGRIGRIEREISRADDVYGDVLASTIASQMGVN